MENFKLWLKEAPSILTSVGNTVPGIDNLLNNTSKKVANIKNGLSRVNPENLDGN